MQKHYDYIIAGAGLAGLSLAYKIKLSPILKDKSILLVDKDKKQTNDRTWCFWSQENELFEDIVYKKWSQITFATFDFENQFEIDPYSYKMIRGIDFYKHVISKLKLSDNVDFLFERIESLKSNSEIVKLKSSTQTITSDYAFQSFLGKREIKPIASSGGNHFVWQHFKGLFIKTSENVFNKSSAHFMDFRIDQGNETRFFYVLPINSKEALIELAIFSDDIPKSSFYDPYLEKYISEILGLNEYAIIGEELGAIPMTTYNFQDTKESRIIKIGTNGGSVKASSGYAFKRIQEDTSNLLSYLERDDLSNYNPKPNRFSLYDRTMLNAILTGKTTGEEIFSKLFKKLKPQTIFKFLDEKGSFFNDLKVFSAPPTLPFAKAFYEEVFKR